MEYRTTPDLLLVSDRRRLLSEKIAFVPKKFRSGDATYFK